MKRANRPKRVERVERKNKQKRELPISPSKRQPRGRVATRPPPKKKTVAQAFREVGKELPQLHKKNEKPKKMEVAKETKVGKKTVLPDEKRLSLSEARKCKKRPTKTKGNGTSRKYIPYC